MGTDRAPSEDVRGAIDALQEMKSRGRNFTLILVGDQAAIEKELAKFPAADRSLRAISPNRSCLSGAFSLQGTKHNLIDSRFSCSAPG